MRNDHKIYFVVNHFMLIKINLRRECIDQDSSMKNQLADHILTTSLDDIFATQLARIKNQIDELL